MQLLKLKPCSPLKVGYLRILLSRVGGITGINNLPIRFYSVCAACWRPNETVSGSDWEDPHLCGNCWYKKRRARIGGGV